MNGIMDNKTALLSIERYIVEGLVSHAEIVELAAMAYAKEAADDARSNDE